MLYIILSTGKCNANCDYCGGSFPEKVVPYEVMYEPEDLIRFISGDRNPILAFYGGEPLLNVDFIRSIMDNITAKFVIQTNGILMGKLGKDYWLRFDTILVSIDGIEQINDLHRGKGMYRVALRMATRLNRMSFQGDLVARMTVTEDTDIYRDVAHLLSLDLFDHVHWQLDVGWSRKWGDFKKWFERSYKPGISQIVNDWLRGTMRGEHCGIAPIQGVLQRIVNGGIKPPCGAGQDACAISTDGRILACPIAVDVRWGDIGHLRTHRWSNLPQVEVEEQCRACEEFEVCGGRCLYMNKERLWDSDTLLGICNATKHLISEVKLAAQILVKSRGYDALKTEMYPGYNNTIEIIP
jgi:putative peptide-modifying radical SAM enzyme